MVIYHSRIDPYDSGYDYYECVGCGHRKTGKQRASVCPECGSWMRDIAVARE